MDATTSVALYARVSSQRQADELTIQSQIAALRQRIEEDGSRVDDERCFLDEGYSGSTLVRPALERLRDLIHCGGVDRVYVHSPDRLSRRYVHQVLLLEEFARQGVPVIFLNHDPQNQSPEGNLLLQMQGMIAEYERAKILERTRRGRRFAARQGKLSVMCKAPYGYRYVSKREGDGEARYDVVLDDARHVREMFTWVALEGISLSQVGRRLAEQGVRTVTGKPRWDTATIRGILINPTYIGTAKYGKTRAFPRVPGRRPQRGAPSVPRQETVSRPTSPEEQVSIPAPALISQELFAAVAERLAENRRRYREQNSGPKFLLSGLLVCHVCGRSYNGRHGPKKQTPRYFYYRCLGTDKYRHAGEVICQNKSVSGRPLEEAVWSDLCALLQDPGRLRRELERRQQRPAPAEVDNLHRRESIAHLKRRLTRLIDVYENGLVDKDEFTSRMSRVQERLKREEEAQAHADREATSEEQLRLVVGQFDQFREQIVTRLEQADFATKRSLLRLLVNRIEVDTDEVRIVYKVHPRPFVLRPVRGDFLQHCLSRAAGLSGRCIAPRSALVQASTETDLQM
jgi:site-specific DNA recombinase